MALALRRSRWRRPSPAQGLQRQLKLQLYLLHRLTCSCRVLRRLMLRYGGLLSARLLLKRM